MPELCHNGLRPGVLATLFALLLCLGMPPARAEVYRIGAEDDWFPYTAYKDGKVQGMSVDIVQAAFDASGVQIELQPYPYARCMEMARNGQLVACFNTSPDARIASQYQLPQTPLFSDDILLWARRDEARPLNRLEQIGQRQVAVTIGYEYGSTFDEMENIRRVAVRKDLNGFRMLLHRRVDFTVAFQGTAHALFDEYPELANQFVPVATVHRPQLYLTFSRQHSQAAVLLQRFDEGMGRIQENGRYREILKQWQHTQTLQ